MRTAALIAAFVSPATALAQTPPLTWNAPRVCPSRAAVLQRATQAGLDPRADGTWTAEATVHRAPAGAGPWRLEMVIHAHGDDVPQRRVAATCAALAQLAAVDLALVVNAHVDPPPPPPPPPPVVVAEPRRVAPPAVPSIVPEPPVRASPRAWRVFVTPAVVLDIGLLPAPSRGVGVGAGVAWPRFRVELRGAWYPAVALETPADAQRFNVRDGVVGSASLAQLSARACWRFGSARWGVAPCVGVEGGWMALRGATDRLNTAVAGDRLWMAAPLLGADASWSPLPALAVSLGVDGALVVVRPLVTIEHLGAVIDTPLLHATLRVGVTLAL